MSNRKKPSVKTRCPANWYASPNERVVEFSDGKGNGGLISFLTTDDGKLLVNLYRLDPNVVVTVPPENQTARMGSDKQGAK